MQAGGWSAARLAETYNQGDVIHFQSTRFRRCFLALRATLVVAVLFLTAAHLPAQTAPGGSMAGSSDDAGSLVGHERIVLVLPFDNRSDNGADAAGPASLAGTTTKSATPTAATTPEALKAADLTSLDWIREAASEILNSRLTSAGFLPLSREDRLYALDHLGLPETFQPSRATALRLAQTLDADSIVIGSYATKGTTLTLKARIVDVPRLTISEEIVVTGEISQLIPLLNSLAWRITRKLDPGFGVAEETFRVAGSKLRLDAFEQYVRGITEPDTAERLRHLKKATDLSPDFTEAWLATGKLEFANQQYEQAAVSFGKVKHGDPSELEAGFYRGLSLMFTGNYPKAEEAFAGVARVLPLPEVVNNEAVASSRRGQNAVALFRQAAAADVTDADYHFNLAVSLHHHGDKNEALAEMAQSLKLRPNDSEAKAAEAAWKSGMDVGGTAGSVGTTDPIERIKRTYNGAAFRQAALMLDAMESSRLAALPGPERAARLSKTAHEKLDRGLLLESEREYQAALTADDHSAEAHAGLAEVRERAGDSDAARKEAQASLDRKPNLEAELVLARLDLAANQLPQARDHAAEAVKLDGSSRAAKDLRKAIDTRMESHPVADAKSAVAPKPETPAKP